MGTLLFIYEISTELIPFIITFLIIYRFERKNGTPFKKRDIFIRLLLSLYVIAVLNVTSAGTIYEIFRYGNSLLKESELKALNLIPFSNGVNISTILNIIMFVPFGVMLPLMWKRKGRLSQALFSGFAFSLIIELSQLLNIRCTDVDDLIANTLGSVIGYLVYQIFFKIFKCKPKKEGYGIYEPMLYVMAMLLGRLLFFNEYSAAKIIFNL